MKLFGFRSQLGRIGLTLALLLGLLWPVSDFDRGFVRAPAAEDHVAYPWESLWSTYIGGMKSIPTKVTDLKKWLVFPEQPVQCESQIDWILSSLSKYGSSAINSKGGAKADKVSSSIHDYLSELQAKNSDCFESASEAYLLGSVYESNRYDAGGESALVTTGCVSNCSGPPQALYLLLLTKALLKARAIRFVTPSSCVIEFAYLCDPGAIQLNPISKPINEGGIYGSSPEDFAGHYFHELNHLFRDKFVSKEYVSSHFPSLTDSSGIDWRNYLLLDETLAKIMAADIQITNQSVSVWGHGKPDVVGNDLTLYLQNGPLQHLLSVESQEGDNFSDYSQFIGATFLRQPGQNGALYSPQRSDDLEYVQDIFVTLQNSYFPGLDASSKTINLTDPNSSLNPLNQSLDFDPLNVLLSANGWGVNPYVSQKTVNLPASEVWQLKDGGLGIFRKSDFEIPIAMFLQEIGQVVDSLKSATPLCLDFNRELIQASTVDAPTNSPMAQYLGGSCIGHGSSQGPAQPENGGRPISGPTSALPLKKSQALAPSLKGQPLNPNGQPIVNLPQVTHGVMVIENGGRPDSPVRP
jgi:hypothetical protein